MASGGPSMYHPWPSMEFAMTTYKLDPLVARPGPSMAMDGMPWSLSTGNNTIHSFPFLRERFLGFVEVVFVGW